MRTLTPSQIRKYDINHKIFYALSNLESRLILFYIVKRSHSAADISHATKIPLSTVYHKIQEMEELSLIFVDKLVYSENNSKTTKFYKSRIKRVDVSLLKGTLELQLVQN